MQEFFLFVLSGHFSSAGRAQIFLGHFCSARALAVHACQGRQFFFPVQSLPAAARKFEFFFFLPSVVSGSLTTLVRTS